MWEWWSSLESVTRFRWRMGSAAIIFALLSALFGGLRWLADNRRDYLKTQQDQELARPRQLSPQQREQFIAILREPPFRVGVQSPIGDPEAITFVGELQAYFTDAGWEAGGLLGDTTYNPPLYGIRIEFDLRIESDEDQETGTLERSVLERAFSIVGIPAQVDVYRTISTVPLKFISLHVGHKPQPSK
jgi:hypothetical protein